MLSFLQDTTATGLWCMLLASSGAILFGFDNGWWGTIQGAEAFLRDYGSCQFVGGVETCNITTPQRSAGSAVQSAGIMVGSLLSVYINKRYGRKWALIAAGIISIVGIVVELTSAVGSARFSQLVVGKTIASFSMGMAANVVPIYLSETSTAAARGATINVYQNLMLIGFITASAVVYGSAQRNDAAAYYIPLGLQLVAPTVMVTLTPLLPESPRWLVFNGRIEEATKSAERLFKTPTNRFDTNAYVHELKIAIEHEKQLEAGWADLLQQPTLRRLLIAIGVQCFQQAQGSSYITNFYVSFLRDQGITDPFPWIMGLLLIYYGGILTGHFLPDAYGRRPVFIWSSALTGVMMVIATTLTMTKSSGKAAMAFNLLWQAANGVISPLVWIICTESAPTANRERVLSVAIFFSFGVSLLITSTSPYIQDPGYGNIGAAIGYIWAGFSFITAVWAFFMVPETKGMSLEQMDYMYEKRIKSRHFGRYHFTHSVAADEVVAEEKEKDITKLEEASTFKA